MFILPGILGSNLKVGNERIWLGWRLLNGLQRLDYRPGTPDGVEPDGPIGMYYDDLGEFLARNHEVIEFAYDWRRPMEDEARRLGDAVERRSPRAARAAAACAWSRTRWAACSRARCSSSVPRRGTAMMAHAGARLLMLGTPNAGSWAPMQVLSGDDTFGNLLVAVGAPFHDKARAGSDGAASRDSSSCRPASSTRRWPSAATRHGRRSPPTTWSACASSSWWHNLKRAARALYVWGVPPQAVLDRAVALRKRLDAQIEQTPAAFRDKLVLVIGRADFTPDGYEIGEEGLVYLDAPDTATGA